MSLFKLFDYYFQDYTNYSCNLYSKVVKKNENLSRWFLKYLPIFEIK